MLWTMELTMDGSTFINTFRANLLMTIYSENSMGFKRISFWFVFLAIFNSVSVVIKVFITVFKLELKNSKKKKTKIEELHLPESICNGLRITNPSLDF